MVFRKCPLRFRLLTLTSPKDEKWVTKPNSRLVPFEFDPAITNFELKYVTICYITKIVYIYIYM